MEEEEEEERHQVQYYCGQRGRAGGSVNATQRPLWYCEAGTAAVQDESKASVAKRNEDRQRPGRLSFFFRN